MASGAIPSARAVFLGDRRLAYREWARTAAEFGYHDESRVIDDVTRLAGATPQQLLAARG